jgi:putative spermidine/putrescine transport system permease protein
MTERLMGSAGRIGLALIGVSVALFLVVPTLIVIPMSFNPDRILEFPPAGFSLRWYEQVFADPAWRTSLVNSLEAASMTAVLATAFGTATAYGLVRGRFRGRMLIAGLTLAPLVVPTVIVAIGMFAVYVRWKLTGSLLGVVIAHTTLAMPFVIVTVATSLRTMDVNLEAAARGLGARRWQTFRRVTLPLTLPGVAAGALFAFVTSWDEVVISLFLTSAKFVTLPVQMWTQVREVVDPTVAAVSTMLLTVTLTLGGLALLVRRR